MHKIILNNSIGVYLSYNIHTIVLYKTVTFYKWNMNTEHVQCLSFGNN